MRSLIKREAQKKMDQKVQNNEKRLGVEGGGNQKVCPPPQAFSVVLETRERRESFPPPLLSFFLITVFYSIFQFSTRAWLGKIVDELVRCGCIALLHTYYVREKVEVDQVTMLKHWASFLGVQGWIGLGFVNLKSIDLSPQVALGHAVESVTGQPYRTRIFGLLNWTRISPFNMVFRMND
jgi:hypothetical protein